MTAREKFGFKLYHASSLQIKGVHSLPISYLLTYTGGGATNMDFIESHSHRGCCLDSGAFPAWKQNKDLDIGKYIQFVKAHQDSLDWFAQLDYIPRQTGGKTEELQKYAADETWERYKAMHEAPEGLDVSKLAFVVHGASDIEPNLVRALSWRSAKTGRGVEMLALGLAFPDPQMRVRQLKIAQKVIQEFGFTGKFHALGVQDRDIYRNFPFITSADSSSSIRLAISGGVQIDGQEYKYERVCLLIVDFNRPVPKVYNTDDELKADGLLPERSTATINQMNYPSFARTLMSIYQDRFGMSRFS